MIIAAMALSAACSPGESDDFQGRLRALDGAYSRGKEARAKYDKVGINIGTETACDDAWVSTGTRDEEPYPRYITDPKTGKQAVDSAFQELRRESFINGCMGRANNLNPSASTRPSVSATPPSTAASAR